MGRFYTILCLTFLAIAPALAEDNGGFGAKFTNQTPSALMEAPNSTLAQSVPDATAMQDIMPAAGEEIESPVTTPSAKIIEVTPTTVEKSMESHVTVPSSVGN